MSLILNISSLIAESRDTRERGNQPQTVANPPQSARGESRAGFADARVG